MRIGPALRSEIESTFQMAPGRSSQTELVFLCPEPGCGDQTGNRSVNTQTGYTNCWRCNKASRNFVQWARHLGYHFSSTGDEEALQGPLDFSLATRTPKGTMLPAIRPVELPEGFEYLADNPESVYTRAIGEMAVRKNLTLEDFVDAHVGFTRVGLWSDYAIFPVVEYRTVVYYQGRTYVDIPGKPTKKFPSNKTVPHGAKYWVYGIDDIIYGQPEIVIVVEAILNVLSLRKRLIELGWSNVVAVSVFKHYASRPQWMKITGNKSVREVCFLFDHDALDNVWETLGRMPVTVPVTVAEMPATPNNRKLDPNDDVEAALDAFEARVPYSSKHALGRKIFAPRSTVHSLAGTRFCSP